MLFFIISGLQSQDIPLSQISNNIHIFNPAFSGFFKGKSRISLSFRDQWFKIQKKSAYKFADLGYYIRFDAFENDFFYLNMNANNADLGVSNLGLTGFKLGGGYARLLAYDKYSHTSQYLAFGTEAGYGILGQEFGSYYFGIQFDKFNETFNGSIPDEENLLNSSSYLDLNLGLAYIWSDENKSFFAGIAAFHLNEPDISLVTASKDKLHRRLNLIIGSDLNLSRDISLLPKVNVMMQGAVFQLLIGSECNYELVDYENNAFRFGIFQKISNSIANVTFSSLALTLNYQLAKLSIGMSYDFDIGKVRILSGNNGAFEINLKYSFGDNDKNSKFSHFHF